MPPFKANVEFHFTAGNIEAAGAEIRRLALAARAAGFELIRGCVEPSVGAPDEDDGSPTSYGPLDEPST